MSYYEDSAENQYAQSPKQQKARSGNEFLGLSRCAACYNHNKSSIHWRGGHGDSSSSAEDSESDVDCESSSSSSCSEHVTVAAAPGKSETERLSTVLGDSVEPKCGGRGNTAQSQEDKIRANGMSRRAPLVKSLSLPPSFTPHLTPFSLLPRPPRVVSTLQLQVLPEKHQDDSFTISQRLSEREHGNSEQSYGVEGRTHNLLHPQPYQWQQTGLPWQRRLQPTLQQHQYQQQHQQQMPHQFQQQLPQHFFPHSAQGQMLPPPSLPVLHPTLHTLLQAQHTPQTHLHALSPQPCWYCYRMHFPYTYWSHYSSGELARW